MTERARIIGGERAAAELVADLSRAVLQFTRASRVVPGLALVALDDDPSQRLYVRKKLLQCAQAGIVPIVCPLQAGATTSAVIDTLNRLNAEPKVHGIFLQWPLPAGVDLDDVSRAIAPDKDVDAMAHDTYSPAAALASYRLLRLARPDPAGLIAAIASESLVFAKPMARMLLAADCEVTLAGANNNELEATCRSADVLIAALGMAAVIRGDWIKPGATVIDAGVNAIAGADGKLSYVGDVNFDEAVAVAGAITPVPGGVGPMTIACLLENTLSAARRQTAMKG
ncbi:MAG: bifunctional 5,10-methylenetetrahydrofolate dehydrogenase/5,10-methenyltetrahydrofolate cyclohydrolase [Steroidobacterales bacterium]